MTGSGTYTYSDGSYASGTFDKNTFVNGSYHIENDFGNYTFTITDGQPTAVEMSLVSGTTYNGAMSDGKLSGQAQIKYSNGDQYNGNVSDGQKSGQGTYTWTSGAYLPTPIRKSSTRSLTHSLQRTWTIPANFLSFFTSFLKEQQIYHACQQHTSRNAGHTEQQCLSAERP